MTLHQIALKKAEAAISDRDPLDTRTLEILVEVVLKVVEEEKEFMRVPTTRESIDTLPHASETEPRTTCNCTKELFYSEANHIQHRRDVAYCDLAIGHLGSHEGMAHGHKWFWNPSAWGILRPWVGSGTPPPSAERSDSTLRSAAKESQNHIVSVSLEEIETARVALFGELGAVFGHVMTEPEYDALTKRVDHLIQVVQAHAAQLQEKKEDKTFTRPDQSGAVTSDPRVGDRGEVRLPETGCTCGLVTRCQVHSL